MLRHLAGDQKRVYVSMDNSRDRELAQTDPKLFFQVYRPPVLIDEVQKAPELFETIKILCDESEERGLFWLTGSQSKKLMRQAGDSLAGRVCILKLYSLSQRELAGIEPEEPLDLSYPALASRSRLFGENNIVTAFFLTFGGAECQRCACWMRNRRESTGIPISRPISCGTLWMTMES